MRCLRVALIIGLAGLLISCGERKVPLAAAPAETWSAQPSTTLSATLAELKEIECPDGVDEALWLELKDALAAHLTTNNQHLPAKASATAGPATARFASAPPAGEANRVDDLRVVDNGDGTCDLTWTYKNIGDYDQNGVVDISDITPIAQHYGELIDETNEWIDGNGNGRITIADISCIATNYRAEVAGYTIWGAETPSDGFTELHTTALPPPSTDEPLSLTAQVPAEDYGALAVKPFADMGESGELSEYGEHMEVSRGPWPMFGRDLQNTRRSPFIGPQSANLKWKFDVGDDFYGSPIIGADGTVYVAGSWPGWLYAIDPGGSLKWKYPIADTWAESPSIGPDGTIYVSDSVSNLDAITPEGEFKWRYEISDWEGGFGSATVLSDGTIYVGTPGRHLAALNSDGTVKWRYNTLLGVHSSPAVGKKGIIYAASSEYYVHAIYPDGTRKWCFLTDYRAWRPCPSIDENGTIYVGCDGPYFYALNADSSRKWSFNLNEGVQASPAIGADGTVYVNADDDYLYAINTDGTLRWKCEIGGSGDSGPAIDGDGTIYIGSWKYVYAISPDGTVMWTYSVLGCGHSSPALSADGTLYIGNGDRFLYAIGD